MPGMQFEERWTDLLDVETVLPDQYRRPAGCGARESSVHRLMLAVLENAIAVYLKASDPHRHVGLRERREVTHWFRSRDRRWLFSFERICEALDFDPDGLRRGLRSWVRAASPHAERNRDLDLGVDRLRGLGLAGPVVTREPSGPARVA